MRPIERRIEKLERGSSGDGIGGAGEDSKAAVALAAWPHHLSIMLGNHLLDQGIVAHQGWPCCGRVLLPQCCAALDIGE